MKQFLMILHAHSINVLGITHFSLAEHLALVPQMKNFICELPIEVDICFVNFQGYGKTSGL